MYSKPISKDLGIPKTWAEPDLNDNRITLSWYDSDLNQKLKLPELNSVIPFSYGAFFHAWAGVRATHGVSGGRVCYEVFVGALVDTTETAEKSVKETVASGLRIGWSTDDSSLHLGEGEFSWGYESSGRAVNNAEFKEYGQQLNENDVVGVYLDLESSPCKMFYNVNGVSQGTAYEFDKSALNGRPLYPHLLSKNRRYKVNFGYESNKVDEELDGTEVLLEPGYCYMSLAQLEEGSRRPATLADCEVILMVGMPGCGKTHWARQHAAAHPEKRYNILSTGALLNKMKVDCKPFKASCEELWDTMVKQCAKSAKKIQEIAKGRRRNYILDQPNVYPDYQEKNLRKFDGYRRVAVVIVTDPETYAARTQQQEETDRMEFSDESIRAMKANFSLPEKGPLLWDDVIYPELGEDATKKILQGWHKEAKGVVEKRKRNDRSRRTNGGGPNKRPRFDDSDGSMDRAGGRWGSVNRGGGGGGGGGRRGPPRDNWGPRNDMGGGGGGGGGRDRDNWDGRGAWGGGGSGRDRDNWDGRGAWGGGGGGRDRDNWDGRGAWGGGGGGRDRDNWDGRGAWGGGGGGRDRDNWDGRGAWGGGGGGRDRDNWDGRGARGGGRGGDQFNRSDRPNNQQGPQYMNQYY